MRSETKHGATSAFAILRAGQECQNFAEAGERLGIPNLGEVLAGSEPFQNAWRRGRFLRRLAELASSPLCRRAVAERLNMSEVQFEELLATDREAGDIFTQARHRFFIEAKSAIMVQAKQGKSHCLRTLERLIEAEAGTQREPTSRVDFGWLSITEMQAATGIARTQLSRWAKNHGLARNADGTFSLPRFIAWLRKFPRGRTRSYRRKPAAIEKRIVHRITEVINEELASLAGQEQGE